MSWLLVFLGGGLGALCRLAVARILPAVDLPAGGFPWATFTANLLACLLLGAGLSLVTRSQLSPNQQLFALTGFCGGFSTFSTFAGDVLILMQGGHFWTAFTYLAASVACGVLAIFGVLLVTAAAA